MVDLHRHVALVTGSPSGVAASPALALAILAPTWSALLATATSARRIRWRQRQIGQAGASTVSE